MQAGEAAKETHRPDHKMESPVFDTVDLAASGSYAIAAEFHYKCNCPSMQCYRARAGQITPTVPHTSSFARSNAARTRADLTRAPAERSN